MTAPGGSTQPSPAQPSRSTETRVCPSSEDTRLGAQVVVADDHAVGRAEAAAHLGVAALHLDEAPRVHAAAGLRAGSKERAAGWSRGQQQPVRRRAAGG